MVYCAVVGTEKVGMEYFMHRDSGVALAGMVWYGMWLMSSRVELSRPVCGVPCVEEGWGGACGICTGLYRGVRLTRDFDGCLYCIALYYSDGDGFCGVGMGLLGLPCG